MIMPFDSVAIGTPTLGPAPVQLARQSIPLTLAFFGHDSSESTIIKRVHTFQDNGVRVVGFMFRRERTGIERDVDWDNIALGVTHDRRYVRRLLNLASGLWRTMMRREALRQCDVMYARNIDMLLLAVTASRVCRLDMPIIYEVLDIREVFQGKRLINRLYRWAERALMANTHMLVVSAPEYMTRYFLPVQNYAGPWHLLENKLNSRQLPVGNDLRPTSTAGPPWVIGLFGVLRCNRSLDLLARLANANPESIIVHLRGTISEADIPPGRIDELTGQNANIRYFGPYRNPDDLGEIYGKVHFVWSADRHDPGNNSAMCLTNRLYEGCYYGALALSDQGTATARKIEHDALGRTFGEPLEQSLQRFFDDLTPITYDDMRAALCAKPRSCFVDTNDTQTLLARIECMSKALRRKYAGSFHMAGEEIV